MTATGVGAGVYYVRIRAKNACGMGGPSNEVVLVVGTPTPTPTAPPSQPQPPATPTTITQTIAGSVSGGDAPCSDGIFVKPCRVYGFRLTSAGALFATLSSAESADLDLSLFRGSQLIASSRGVRNSEAVSANLSPSDYELRVTYYSGSTIANFTLTVTRPN
jgi:hypothetical protein